MYGICASTWQAVLAIREHDKLWTVRRAGAQAIAFSSGDAAQRFARIVGNAEDQACEVRELKGGALSAWLDALAFEDTELLLEPEYVHGDGPIGDLVPSGELRSALSAVPAA